MTTETKETKKVSSNPAKVEFPRDPWGFTTELRKAGLQAASGVRGDVDKNALFLQTLRILAQHAQSRLNSDAAAVVARGAVIAERNANPYRKQPGKAAE